MTIRTLIAVSFAATLSVGVLASPATADAVSLTDAPNDVVDESGAAVIEPTVDIDAVDFTNEPDRLQVVVTVDTGVRFTDVRWTSGELDLDVFMTDPGSTSPFGLIWTVVVDGAGAHGEIQQFPGTAICTTTALSASRLGTYTLTADETCARSLPRTLQVQASMEDDDGSRVASDEAPDGADSDPVSSAANGRAIRLAGTDRILTAIALSADEFGPGDASAVVLASSTNFPDALAGGPLAVVSDAPLLLTAPTGLDSRVADEIDRVLAPGGTVYLLGGTAALSDQVASDVTTTGFRPQRVAGVNRFETALAIADAVDAIDPHSGVLIADGRSFTDALIAGAAAGQFAVVVLTDGATMPASTGAYLRTDSTDQTAIGDNAVTAVGSTSGIDHINGASPAELSVSVADSFGEVRGAVAIASAANFPDSLAGGPHIARLNGALLLTDPNTLSPAVRTWIEDANGHLREVDVYGGTAAVSEGVVDAIGLAL